MTKTFIHTALAAVAALTLIPAIASAQPANAPRKPVAAERKIEPAKPAGPQAQRPSAKRFDHPRPDGVRPGLQAQRDGHRQRFAERGGDRDHHRAGRDHDKAGDHGKRGDHRRGDHDKRGGDMHRG